MTPPLSETPTRREIVIVGAGLSGLALATRLRAAGRDVVVLEARARVGGRIEGMRAADGTGTYDLGPAWLWPHNRHMRALVRALGLEEMPQHATGRLVFEDPRGAVRRDLDFATMGDALRIAGGLAQVPEALAAGLGPDHLRLGHRVTRIVLDDTGYRDGIRVSGTHADGDFLWHATQVVLALPPRLAAAALTLSPPLPDPIRSAMRAVPTWMAGQAKVVATYDRAFWRAQGLSGDAISHRGPLMEIHDASPDADARSGGALFGFVHPAHLRRTEAPTFEDAVRRQLAGLFGEEAAQSADLQVKNWSRAQDTATPDDLDAPATHPAYHPIVLEAAPWAGRLFLAGTEVAPRDGGFLEGALISAEACAQAVLGAGTARERG